MEWARTRRAKLRGASVAVTGGARGIGREAAARLRSAGARVAIGDLDLPVAEQTAAALGPDVVALPLDVADRGSFETFLAEAQRLNGPLDVLVSNAGVMPLGRFLDGDPGVFDRTLDVNFGGTVNALSLALPGMVERGRGRVVVVASLMGRVTVPGAAVYGASKYAVVALCEAVRRELRGTGVGLVTILPAMVRTELSSGVPEGRALPVVEPGRVARAIVRACADGRPEVAVPAWAGGFARIGGALPPSLMTPVRRMLGDERALTQIDEERRRLYEERIRPG